ncbi:MAG: hypothetical protein WC471_03140 [Candidatus Woesearchaeota archaeon]
MDIIFTYFLYGLCAIGAVIVACKVLSLVYFKSFEEIEMDKFEEEFAKIRITCITCQKEITSQEMYCDDMNMNDGFYCSEACVSKGQEKIAFGGRIFGIPEQITRSGALDILWDREMYRRNHAQQIYRD